MRKDSACPVISVITPSLNQGAFIERTIRSVLDQGWPKLEYIIIDGQSMDGSVEIIRKYADRLAYWCSEPDGGQTHAINKGLRRASGDIIAYLCSDDQYLPGSFEKVADYFNRFPKVRWLAGACRFSRPDGSEYTWVPQLPPKDPVAVVCGPWGVPQPANFWRRELFAQYGPFREDFNYVMDTEFQVRLAMAGEIPAILPVEFAYSVLHPDCKTVKAEATMLREQSKFLSLFWDQLTVEERTKARVTVCFRESGIAKKLGRGQVLQYLLYLKGLLQALRISPELTLKRLVGVMRRSFMSS